MKPPRYTRSHLPSGLVSSVVENSEKVYLQVAVTRIHVVYRGVIRVGITLCACVRARARVKHPPPPFTEIPISSI